MTTTITSAIYIFDFCLTGLRRVSQKQTSGNCGLGFCRPDALPASKHQTEGCCVIVFIYRKQAPWDPEILRAVKARDHSVVLYTARPATMRANQVPYELKESRMKKNASFTTSSAGHNGSLSFSHCFYYQLVCLIMYTQDVLYNNIFPVNQA